MIPQNNKIVYYSITTIFCLSFFILFAYSHYYFINSSDVDHAYHLKILYNQFNEGRLFESFRGLYFERIHFQVFLYLLAPLFLFPCTVYLLYFIKFFFIYLVSAYYISKLYKNNISPVVLIFLLNPMVYGVILFFFNNVTVFVIPVIFAVCYYYRNFNKKKLFAALLFLSLTKEISVFVSLGFALLLLFKKKYRFSFAIILLNVILLLFYFKVYIPGFAELGDDGRNVYLNSSHYYKHLGGSFYNIINISFNNPCKIIRLILRPANLKYLLLIFLPYLFISFLKIEYLIPLIPILLINLLGSQGFMVSFFNYYQSYNVPFIFSSFLLGINKIKLSINSRNNSYFVIPILLMVLFSNLLLFNNIRDRYRILIHPDRSELKKETVKLIPNNCSVMSSFSFFPYLYYLKDAHSFYYKNVTDDYILLDLSDDNREYMDGEIVLIKSLVNIIDLLEKNRYQIIYYKDNILLLKKGNSNKNQNAVEKIKSKVDSLVLKYGNKYKKKIFFDFPRRVKYYGPFKKNIILLDLYIPNKNPDIKYFVKSNTGLTVLKTEDYYYFSKPYINIEHLNQGSNILNITAINEISKIKDDISIEIIKDNTEPRIIYYPEKSIPEKGYYYIKFYDDISIIKPLYSFDSVNYYPLAIKYINNVPPYTIDERYEDDHLPSCLYISEYCGKQEYSRLWKIKQDTENDYIYFKVLDKAGNSKGTVFHFP